MTVLAAITHSASAEIATALSAVAVTDKMTRPMPRTPSEVQSRQSSRSPRMLAITAVTPTLAVTIAWTRNSGSCCSATTLATKASPSQASPSR